MARVERQSAPSTGNIHSPRLTARPAPLIYSAPDSYIFSAILSGISRFMLLVREQLAAAAACTHKSTHARTHTHTRRRKGKAECAASSQGPQARADIFVNAREALFKEEKKGYLFALARLSLCVHVFGIICVALRPIPFKVRISMRSDLSLFLPLSL